MSTERDDLLDEEERDDYGSSSILAAGWFRAVLVLGVLAVIVVISLPYLLSWFEPGPPALVTKPADAPAAPVVAPMPSPSPVPSAPPDARSAPAVSERAPVPRTVTAGDAARPAPPKVAADKAIAPRTASKPAADKMAAKGTPSARPASSVTTRSARQAPATTAGRFWVQLGAFKDERKAEALAKSVRAAGFTVQVSPVRQDSAADVASTQHELFVPGTSAERVNAALKGRGTAQAVSGGFAVKPALSLQDAMTVSKRLTDEGLRVVVRPASSGAVATGATLHAVRAGEYASHESALAARNRLEAKGYKGFVAEGASK